MKLAGEQLRLSVAVSPEDRASVELSIAEHRLDEAERLATAGREDDAIVAAAAYGSSLADAAADLASVEGTDPRTAALVAQMQTTLVASQLRVAATASHLAADPRTSSTAEVLAAVGTAPAAGKGSPATRIADQAAALTAKLSTVAGDRADRAAPERDVAPRRASPTRTPLTAVTGPGGTSETLRPATPTTRAALTPPANPSAARQAAEKAKEAAEKALEAAAKAKRLAARTPSPLPTRR